MEQRWYRWRVPHRAQQGAEPRAVAAHLQVQVQEQVQVQVQVQVVHLTYPLQYIYQ